MPDIWRAAPANAPRFSIITGPTVADILLSDTEACIQTVKSAYIAHSHGLSVNPPSTFLRFPDRPDARIIGLPSHLGQPWQISGIKWISSYPGNLALNLPRASAVLILNSDETGYPLACIEASIISAVRTAASAVLAAAELSGRGLTARGLAIVGTGLIATYVYRLLMTCGWQIDEVHLLDTDPERASAFSENVISGDKHASVALAPDFATAARASDLILFTTVAGVPHIHDPTLFAHNPIMLHISLRDLSPEIILGACNVTDDVEHVMKADTSLHLTEKKTGHRNFVAGTLTDVIEGNARLDRDRPIVFSPFGLGVLDLAIGKLVYDRARESGRLVDIENFF